MNSLPSLCSFVLSWKKTRHKIDNELWRFFFSWFWGNTARFWCFLSLDFLYLLSSSYIGSILFIYIYIYICWYVSIYLCLLSPSSFLSFTISSYTSSWNNLSLSISSPSSAYAFHRVGIRLCLFLCLIATGLVFYVLFYLKFVNLFSCGGRESVIALVCQLTLKISSTAWYFIV